MATVSVIVPFFQKQTGLLSNAINSVCAQTVDSSIEVLVIDDESPVKPEAEIPDVLPDRIQVRVLKQRNGGPGAGRRRGLGEVLAETRDGALSVCGVHRGNRLLRKSRDEHG